MKTLIAYYSRTGVTRQVAQELARQMSSDLEELIDEKDRSGVKGYVIAGKDAVLKKSASIKPLGRDPGQYDMVILATPVWGFTMACAMRTYIETMKEKIKNTAFVCTQGSTGAKNTFLHMRELLGKDPKATVELNEREVRLNSHQEKLSSFCQDLVR